MMQQKDRMLTIIFTLSSMALYGAHPQWNNTLNFEEIEQRLQTESITSSSSIRSFLKKVGKTPNGTHPVKFIELESGLKAVFKKENACYGEVAAYKASKALGLRLVPPTVLRKINGEVGSLQFYVDSSIDLMQNPRTVFRKLDYKSRSDMELFYFLIGQWDTHAGNQIIAYNDDTYYLALIDNGGILRRQYAIFGECSFTQKGTIGDPSENDSEPAFPFSKARTVDLQKNSNQAYQLLKSYLTKKYISSLGSSMTYVIWKKTCYIKRQFALPSMKKFATSTLAAVEKLDRKALEEIWADYMPIDPTRCNDLIELILDRREQILHETK